MNYIKLLILKSGASDKTVPFKTFYLMQLDLQIQPRPLQNWSRQ